MIVYHLDDMGGFTVGNTETGFTRYAYPTSQHATTAKTRPDRAAKEMANAFDVRAPDYSEYHDSNWKRLAQAGQPVCKPRTAQARVRAAIARIKGEFDQPDLVAFGPLTVSPIMDVLEILTEGETK